MFRKQNQENFIKFLTNTHALKRNWRHDMSKVRTTTSFHGPKINCSLLHMKGDIWKLNYAALYAVVTR